MSTKPPEFTARHCRVPSCLVLESEGYSEMIRDIKDHDLVEFIQTLFDDSGLQYSVDDYLCKHHIQLASLVHQGKQSGILTRLQASSVLKSVAPDEDSPNDECVLCLKPYTVGKQTYPYSQLKAIQNDKFRQYLNKKHKKDGGKIGRTDRICKNCILSQRRRWIGEYSTPLKKMLPVCEACDCQKRSVGQPIALNSPSVFGEHIPEEFKQGISLHRFCNDHKKYHYRRDHHMICIVCEN